MINELRMYTTRPGKMHHVVNASATVAQKIRNGDTYGKLIGHWSSELGRMNQYIHMWEYSDVEEMRKLRSELAAKEEWKSKFVPLVGPYILTQEIRLLRPLTKIKQPTTTTNIYELKIIKLNIGQAIKWKDKFLDIVSSIEGTSLNIGLWNTELQDPNEIISIWCHPNIESMSKYWRDLDENKYWIDFNAYQENSVKYEESIILRPSICSPLK
ncbi:MAG: NIPSNAP family protein [Alphaproteobacteria bacterium]|nr:NIPSNAP family protein [Alphaproteobacteria bacterium]